MQYLYISRSLIVSCFLTRLISARFLIRILHIKRIYSVCCIMAIAFIMIGISAQYSSDNNFYYLSLLAACCFGTAIALSEVTVLGFCKGYPSRLVGMFSSGTGFSGIFSSCLLIALKIKGVPLNVIFFLFSPCALAYLCCFSFVHRVKENHPCYSIV